MKYLLSTFLSGALLIILFGSGDNPAACIKLSGRVVGVHKASVKLGLNGTPES